MKSVPFIMKPWIDEIAEAKKLLDNRWGAQRELARFMEVPPQRLTEIFTSKTNPHVNRLNRFRAGLERERRRQRRG